MRFGLPEIAFRKHLSTLFIAVLIMHLADYVIIPILPVLLSINQGLRADQIGFIIGIGSLSFQFGSIIGGIISDRIGRKVTLVTGSAIEIFALIGFGLSNHYNHFVLFQILNGIGGGIYAPTIKASIAEYSKDSTYIRTTAFSLRGMAANLGIAIGGMIPLIAIGFKFIHYFIIAALFNFLLLLLSLFFISNTCEEAKCGNLSLSRYLNIFKNKPFLVFSVTTILVWVIYIQLFLLLPLRASSIFENGKIVGPIWTITSLIVVFFQTFIVRHIISKIHIIKSIALGTLIMGFGIFLIGFSNSYFLLVLSAVIFIIGEMLTIPTVDSFTSELAEPTLIGAYFSVANIVFGIGTALGSFISGEIIKTYGIINTMVPWFIFLLSSIIISIIIYLTKSLPLMKDIAD